MTNTSYFEAAVDLDERRLPLPGEFIGKVVPFTFKNQHYQICFPNFDFQPNDRGGQATVTRRDTKIALNWIEGNERRYAHKIGSEIGNDGTGVTKFSVSRLIVRSSKPVTSAVARKAKHDLAEWRDLFIVWLEALEYRDLENSSLDVDQRKYIDAYSVASGKASRVRRIKRKNENSATIRISIISSINPKMFRKALRQANLRKYPPDYYKLLIKGLKYFNEGQYRQSLFDTATATEMTLAQLLDDMLTIRVPRHKKRLMKDYWQLKGLILGLTTLGLTINPDIAAKIGTPRNKAIHAGEEVSKTQAQEALKTAKAFILTTFPL